MKELSKSLEKKLSKNKKDLIKYLNSKLNPNDEIRYFIDYKTTWSWRGSGNSNIRLFNTDLGCCVIKNNTSNKYEISVEEFIKSLNSRDCFVLVVNSKSLEEDLSKLYFDKQVSNEKELMYDSDENSNLSLSFSSISNEVSLFSLLDGSSQSFRIGRNIVEGHGLGIIIKQFGFSYAVLIESLKKQIVSRIKENKSFEDLLIKYKYYSDRVLVTECYYDIMKIIQKYVDPEFNLLKIYDDRLHFFDIEGFKAAPIGAKLKDFVNMNAIEEK